MLTRLSKMMVVISTVLSVAFMGAALVIRNSGPNWALDMRELSPTPELVPKPKAAPRTLADYTFTQAPGVTPTWSAQHRKDTAPVASSLALPEVISKAYQDAERRNRERIDQIQPGIQPLETRITSTRTMLEADRKALDARVAQLNQALTDIEKQITDSALQGEGKATQALDIRSEAEGLRESVMRLRRQLAEIETDHFQIVEQKHLFQDLLRQLQGLQLRLKDRNAQLIRDGARLPAAAPQPAQPSA